MSFFEELKRRNVFRVAFAYSVTSWLVAQIAELAFDNFGAPDWVLKTLLFLLIIGLPFAVLFAWAYELTPEGLKREKDVDRSHSITSQTGRRIDYIIIGLLSVALVFFIATHQWTDAVVGEVVETDTPQKQSIAVLPFENMSDDPGNEYFSDGISEELLNVLVKVQGLRVASRTSSFSFKGSNTPIPDIAAQLGVANVLEGSVRKSGNKVRITAQLIDVETDSHLWSETYDRKLDDIFAVQDEIALAIVNELASTLGAGAVPTERVTEHSTENIEAYELYLRGRHLWQRRGDDILTAIDLFERAIELDPQFGRAWSSLAAANITVISYFPDVDVDARIASARAAAEKALEIDDTLAEAHAVLGDINRFEWDWLGAEEHYVAAIEAEPSSATAHLWYGEHFNSLGKFDDALIEAELAFELDPLGPGTNSILAVVHEARGEDEAWMEHAETAMNLGHPSGLFDAVDYRVRIGDYAGALEYFERHNGMLPPDQVNAEVLQLWIAAYETGDRATQDAYLDSFKATFGSETMFLLPDFANFGRIDEAFEYVGDGEHLVGNQWFAVWRTDMGPFRADPRFGELLKSTGVIDYWDQHGWSPLCERVDAEIRCR